MILKVPQLWMVGRQVLARLHKPEIAKANIALTMRCNHKCQSCNIWKLNGEAKTELTVGDIGAIIAHNPALMWASITGGEPSLARDFSNILGYCMDYLPITSVVTNGERPDIIVPAIKDALKYTSKKHVLLVHVSLYGEADVHNSMTGITGAYSRAIDTMRGLCDLEDNGRLILGFEHMRGKNNTGEDQFINYKAKRLGVGHIFTREQESDYYGNNGHDCRVKPGRRNCVAGEYSCWVMPDKNVYPCLFAIPKQVSFNLSDTGYELRREHFSQQMEWIQKCRGCLTPCEASQTLMFRPWRLVWN